MIKYHHFNPNRILKLLMTNKTSRMKEPTTALVTGGGRGIGKENAIMLSEKGMNVVICSRTQKEIDSVVKEIKMLGNNHIMGRKCEQI